jgi:hypothetical protein
MPLGVIWVSPAAVVHRQPEVLIRQPRLNREPLGLGASPALQMHLKTQHGGNRAHNPFVLSVCRVKGIRAVKRVPASAIVTSSGLRPRWPCENTKVLGFRVSLYPSRVATSPLRGDLKGRLLRRLQSERVFTRPEADMVMNGASGPACVGDRRCRRESVIARTASCGDRQRA